MVFSQTLPEIRARPCIRILNLFSEDSLSLCNLVLVCPLLITQFFVSIRLAQTKMLFVEAQLRFLINFTSKFFSKLSSQVSKLLTFSLLQNYI